MKSHFEPKMPDKYDAPRTWHETKILQHKMQRDLLLDAFRRHSTRLEAADEIGMSWNAMGQACRRLGVALPSYDTKSSEENQCQD